MTKIYFLSDPDGGVRYVGKTVNSLRKRLMGHLINARNGLENHRCNWIRLLLSKGKIPSIIFIGEVLGDGIKEERAWIKYFRDEGVALVNGTEGGEGWNVGEVKHSDKTKVKISQALLGNQNAKDSKHSDVTKEKCRLAAFKVHHRSWESLPEETREKIRLSAVGNHRRRGSKNTPETICKMRLAQKAWRLKKDEAKNEIR